MAGTFTVVTADSGESGASVAGASPHGAIFLSEGTGPGLVTLEITDVPGSHFRSTRHEALSPVTKTRSLEIIPPDSSVNFIMSDTAGVHTITSLIWPSEAGDETLEGDSRRIPFDQIKPYRGGGIVRLSTPGLYVFTCKVHPYMFGAVIVDDPATTEIDLGSTIDIAGGLKDIPTSSDLATQLLSLFVSTTHENWRDYSSSEPWTVAYPDIMVLTDLADPINLNQELLNRYHTVDGTVNAVPLEPLLDPETPGIGEVWIDTQSEQTAGKTKHGTVTVFNAETWKFSRKIALPEINMNNPHNMWSNKAQSVVFITQWFDNRMTFVNRADGTLINDIRVGDSPAHVMTLPTTDELLITLNSENGIARIQSGTFEVDKRTPTQLPGADNANPHGHWIKHDGNGVLAIGVLPVQTPVSPNGKAVVTAQLLGMITVVDTETDEIVKMLECDPGCHGANFGAKQGGGYYAYVTSQFSNVVRVVDIDPNGNGDLSDAEVVGRILMVADSSVPTDDAIVGMEGQGGQGVLAIPNVYNGWVQNLPDNWKADLTAAQLNPVP